MNRRTIVFAGLGVFVLVIIAGVLGNSVRNTRECKARLADAEAALTAGNLPLARSLADGVRTRCGANNFPRVDAIDAHVRALYEEKDRAALAAAEAEKKTNEAALEEVTAKLEPTWLAYDHAQVYNNPALFATVDRVAKITKTLPTRLWPMADRYNQAMYRARGAVLVRPETRARGDWFEVLVPSPNPAQCLVWGSMWSNDSAPLVEMGFVKIHCDAPPAGTAREWLLGPSSGTIP